MEPSFAFNWPTWLKPAYMRAAGNKGKMQVAKRRKKLTYEASYYERQHAKRIKKRKAQRRARRITRLHRK